ncbi:MAG: hypothetical protein J6I36_11525 [Bacteroidaceae bacterium]|nr:hypothetical protein [Bacteroidaceae bacterium]
MKKVIIGFMALLFAAVQAYADGIVVRDVTIQQGGSATLEVALNNTEASYRAVLLDITLPAGVRTLTDEYGDIQCEKGTRLSANYAVTGNHLVSGADRFAIINTTDNEPIAGQSGALFTFSIAADEEALAGTYTATVSSIKLTDADAVDHPQANFTFVVTVEENDGRIHFGESDAKLPSFVAGEKGDVRMTRSIKAGTWSTIVLPFTLTMAKAKAVFGDDVELAEFSGFEVDYGEDEENVTPLGITVNFSTYTMSARKPMTGGKPFLIRTSTDITSFEADDVSLVEEVADVEKADEYDTAGKFTGSFVKTVVPADCLFLNSNKFFYSTGKTNIKAFRGWFELDAVLNQETDFGVKMVIDGFETNVEGVSVKDAAGMIYDLSGRKVSKAGKGIYIVNGKKVLVN